MALEKDALYQAALDYHKKSGGPGKIAITPTKSLATQRELSLAYSPGVAAPCLEIEKDPGAARDYTARGNMVAVITNGTAVLGLGDIGPLASKPVMEGKSVLFKKFADIDSIDIEIDEKDPKKLIDIIASLEPSFGGINLEDIKAPECFEIERTLKERMNIPVFHDDQHGTAIIVGAAFTNWLAWSERKAKDVKLVVSGAGASALSCVQTLKSLGLPAENIIVCDRRGVIYRGRNEGMTAEKEVIAANTPHRTIQDAMKNADIFLGLSGPGVVTQADVATMNSAPLMMTLANPTPEIMPEDVRAAQPEAVICTGRSDYPNQVNNVLCFPFIFRGALDAGATAINEDMKLACVQALAKMARHEVPPEVAALYPGAELAFGPEYLIPKPFDPRLITELPPAVARAAAESGVAERPIEDFASYRRKLERNIFKSGQLMRPIYAQAAANKKRLVLAEGEEERVLHAAQILVDDAIARPILIGREDVILARIRKNGLRLKKDQDFELVNPERDERYTDYWQTYHELMARDGITPALARQQIRTINSIIGAMLLYKDDADAMICGTIGRYDRHFHYIRDIIGKSDDVASFSTMNVLILPQGTYFLCDAFVNRDPTAEQIRDMTLQAAEEIRRFGITPKVALLSHSDFGSQRHPEAVKMRAAAQMIKNIDPELEIDGEMTASAALSERVRNDLFPNSVLTGQPNLLVMPNIDAANITFHTIKALSRGITVGPLLLGAKKSVHILIPSVTARGIVNAAAYACYKAHALDMEKQEQ